jgi:hypothetical protein
MSRNSSTIEDRLAAYRPTLEDAIAHQSSAPAADRWLLTDDVIELDVRPAENLPSARSRLVMGAAAVVLLGGVGAVVLTRGTPGGNPSSHVLPAEATSSPSNASEPIVDTVPAGTVPAGTVPGSGQTPACPPETATIGTGTLYLGGPASDQNLAAAGFIFSLPSGPTPVDVAMKAVGLSVLGLECSISGTANADGSIVTVTADPPAVPAPIQIHVGVSEHDGVIGVTNISSGVDAVASVSDGVTSLRLRGGLPAATAQVQVRFKKGEDVWELSAEPTIGKDIALTVPEADHYPDQPVDWVLFTLLDDDFRLVGVGSVILD